MKSTIYSRSALLLGLWLGLLGLSLVSQAQTIRYVKEGANGSGSSWADASGDLQSQINASGPGDEVWVAAGTYNPASTLVMKNGVAIYGGFPSSGDPRPSERKPASYPTILSRASGRVIVSSSIVTSTAVLDGFIITGKNGGGMLNDHGSPTLRNCLFQNNSANSGGALFNLSGSPKLINCSFQNNSASNGGAIYTDNDNVGRAVLINCSFQGNSATNVGGAIYNIELSERSDRFVLVGCVLFGNGGENTISGPSGAITAYGCLIEDTLDPYQYSGYPPDFVDLGNITTSVSPFASTTSTQLNACSPAINAGSTKFYTDQGGTPTDLAGNPRVFPTGGVIDLGAYEFQGDPNHPLTITSHPPVPRPFVPGSPSQ